MSTCFTNTERIRAVFAQIACAGSAARLSGVRAVLSAAVLFISIFTYPASAQVPNLSYANAVKTTVNFGQAFLVAPSVMQKGASNLTGCGIKTGTTALPAGLSIHQGTCIIMGTATSTFSATTLTIVATNSAGASNQASVTLTVTALAPFLIYPSTASVATTGVATTINPTTLLARGALITACAVKANTTALPAWASINASTCVISGTPNATLSKTTYTIVATNSVGTSNEATVSMQVSTPKPVLLFSASTKVAYVGIPLSLAPTTLNTNGGTITRCTLNSNATPLPKGISINPTTCAITGTASNSRSETTYAVLAANAAGSDAGSSGSVKLKILPLTISISSGDNQSGFVGGSLSSPLVVLVKDSENNPAPNITVEWKIDAGSATPSASSTTTNSSGLAQTNIALGSGIGTLQIKARVLGTMVPAVKVSFAATSTPGSFSNFAIGSVPTGTSAGAPVNITLTARDSGGNTKSNYTGTVTFSSSDAQAVLPAPYTFQLTDKGIKKLTFKLKTAGSRTITFTPSSGTAATTSAITVTAAAVRKLSFLAQPSSKKINKSLGTLTVRARDSYDNPVTAFNSAVTIAIDNNPGSGTLSGTLTASASNGLATFTGLSINNAGTGYTLRATSGSLTAATSASFTITAPVPFTRNWPFDFGSNSSYTLGSGVELAGGVARLSSTDQLDDDNTGDGFWAATTNNVVWDSTNNYVRMTYQSYPGELDSSWTPQWSSLVSYWKFNGNSRDSKGVNHGSSTYPGIYGTVATSQSSNTPTLVKVGTHSGLFNNVRYDRVGYDASLNIQAKLTIMAWVYPTPANWQGAEIFCHSTANVAMGYSFALSPVNLNLVLRGAKQTSWSNTSTSTIPLSQWTHVAAVADGDRVKYYINGVLDRDLDVVNGNFAASSSGVLGSMGFGPNAGSYYYGNIDDLAIWNTDLTASEIQTIYTRQVNQPSSVTTASEFDASWTPSWANLNTYFKFNEASGATTVSSSVGSVSATPNAGVTLGKMGNQNTAALFSTGSIPLNTNITGAANTVTISAWLFPTNLTSTRTFFSNKGGQATTATNGYYAELTSAAKVNMVGSSGTALLSTSTIPTNQWTHVVTVFSGAMGYIYINGALDASGAITSIAENTTNASYIGNYGGSATYFAGLIDDLGVWNTALSATEVKTISERQAAKWSGTLLSRIMDGKGPGQSWNTLSIQTTFPFSKPLPNNASSESSTTYSGQVDNLMSGNMALWHFDEASLSGVTGEVKDSSGQGNHGTRNNTTVTTSSLGKIGNAGKFSGGYNSSINVPNATSLNQTTQITVSAWINTPTPMSGAGVILSKGASQWEFGFSVNAGKIRLGVFAGGSWSEGNQGHQTTIVLPNTWYHMVATYDGTYVNNYVNGVLDYRYAKTGTLNVTTTNVSIGARGASTTLFNGMIDEVGIWDRALSTTEVAQLYRRGANRLKYQVRTCSSSDCTDQSSVAGQGWKGPDNTQNSYLSEVYNTTSNALNGTVLTSQPNYSLANFASLSLTTNRYFQYRAIFESDDYNLLCNYGSGNVPCSPEVKSVAVGPNHYSSSAPTISNNSGESFDTLSSLAQTLGANGCSSGVTYNVSRDNATWYWWNAGSNAWATANGTTAQSNAATVMSSNAASFATQVGTGTVYFKAFLNSTGSAACELDDMQISGTQ